MRRRARGGPAIAAVVCATALLALSGTAAAAVIKVNTTADEYGVGGSCSLREAITAANADAAFGGCKAGSGTDEVRLVAGAVYGRSIDGNAEDANATGDLDVTSPMSIGPKDGKATIDANTFDRVLDVGGGAVLHLSRTRLTGASETYPPAVVDGAGISVSGGAVLRTDRVVIAGNETLGNSSNNGGGLLLNGGDVTLDRTTIKDNRADNVGGGIAVYTGDLRIKRSSIVDNHSGYIGGGLYLGGDLFNPDSAVITDSTIAGNEADGNGGGIHVSIYGDGVDLTNVTLSGNKSAESGGGIYQYAGTVDLNSVTMTKNTADADASGTGHGGAIAGGFVSYVNSILAGNFDLNPTAPQADCATSGSLGRNVIGAGTGCTAGPGDVTASPKLGPLRNNGGPTKTHAIKRGSSAIGLAKKSLAPRRDQRGVRRDRSPDSGAFERG